MRIDAFLKDNERFSKRRVKFYFDSAGENYFLIMDPGRETGRLRTKSFRYKWFRYKLSQAVKLHKNFVHFKYSLRVKIVGEYSSFFQPRTWN